MKIKKILSNKVLIKRLEMKLSSGLIVDNTSIEPYFRGEVLMVGDKTSNTKVGDTVRTGYHHGMDWKEAINALEPDKQDTLKLINEEDIWAFE
jgi:co-chaperonin GroES (HSP10)